jgi:CDP-diglyceride synthetase
MTDPLRARLGLAAQLLAAGALALWRLLRMKIDSGVHTDWVLVLALLWIALALAGPRRALRDALFVAASLWLLLVYGWFQMGETLRFFKMLADGWW